MRIAVSGSHGTGKSTLVAELSRLLRSYISVEEAYYALLADGHVFADLPTADDYEVLLQHSCESLTRLTAADVLFDRAPVDYWAYLVAKDRDAAIERSELFDRVMDAMTRVDLVVFVPVEKPDRIDIDASEGLKLRQRVDTLLREYLVDDSLGLGVPTLEVTGTPVERARQVLAYTGVT